MDLDSYIIRIYRGSPPAPGDGQLVGVVENLDGEMRSFQSVNELWVILEQSRGPSPDHTVDDPGGAARKKK